MQAHGPGFSKILLGDDRSISWEQYLDVMVDSVFLNSGRGCINCSGIWASRHTREIADAHRAAAGRDRGRCRPSIPTPAWPRSPCPGVAEAISQSIDADLQAPGVTDVTAKYRDGGRGSSRRAAPTTCCRPSSTASRRTRPIAKKEYMFPFVTVVECPQAKMLEAIGPTLVCTRDHLQRPDFRRRLIDAVHIDRLNLGPVPTTQLNWLQPHEGNIVEFLFRARAFQTARSDAVRPVPPSRQRRRRVAMRILSITAGAAGMYCGSCFARQRAGGRAAARAATT